MAWYGAAQKITILPTKWLDVIKCINTILPFNRPSCWPSPNFFRLFTNSFSTYSQSSLLALPIPLPTPFPPHPPSNYPFCPACYIKFKETNHTKQKKKPTKKPKTKNALQNRDSLSPHGINPRWGGGFTRLQRLSSFCSSKQKKTLSIRWTITRKAWRKID